MMIAQFSYVTSFRAHFHVVTLSVFWTEFAFNRGNCRKRFFSSAYKRLNEIREGLTTANRGSEKIGTTQWGRGG